MVPVPIATAVAEGDLIGLDSVGSVVLASGETWNTDKYTTRELFCKKFAGVSAQVKAANAAVQWNSGYSGMLKIYPGGVGRRPAAAGGVRGRAGL